MRTTVLPFSAITALLLLGCSQINDSWEVKGGGYFKYTVNGSKSYTIELDEDDVILPDYGRSFFQMQTRLNESSRGDQFSILVNRPVLGKNHADQKYSWMIAENSAKGHLVGDDNLVKFDQKDDSTWTANIDLQFQDCRNKDCSDQGDPIHVEGRIRYWIPLDER